MSFDKIFDLTGGGVYIYIFSKYNKEGKQVLIEKFERSNARGREEATQEAQKTRATTEVHTPLVFLRFHKLGAQDLSQKTDLEENRLLLIQHWMKHPMA